MNYKYLEFFTYILLIFILLTNISCIENTSELITKFNCTEDGMISIKGERKFIIGSYHLPKTEKPLQYTAFKWLQLCKSE